MFFLGVDVSKKTLSVVLTDHKDKTLYFECAFRSGIQSGLRFRA